MAAAKKAEAAAASSSGSNTQGPAKVVKECKRLDSKEDIKDHNKSGNVQHKAQGVKREATTGDKQVGNGVRAFAVNETSLVPFFPAA